MRRRIFFFHTRYSFRPEFSGALLPLIHTFIDCLFFSICVTKAAQLSFLFTIIPTLLLFRPLWMIANVNDLYFFFVLRSLNAEEASTFVQYLHVIDLRTNMSSIQSCSLSEAENVSAPCNHNHGVLDTTFYTQHLPMPVMSFPFHKRSKG